MGLTVKQRASLHLEGTTSIDRETVMNLLEATAGTVKGGGASLLTTGLWNIGAHINIVNRSEGGFEFALNSGKDLVELCTFGASVHSDDAGNTVLRVGGLDTYTTSQSKVYGFIPAGPKMIHGMDPYKRYLNAVLEEIKNRDPEAELVIQQDGA
ncbi:MAG: hypothetical protein LBU13_09745 [Synergistaceae bacterium]|jgi:hypothetical protein|nr:hypothetical protein [Synergistaceae bacterium]